MLDELIIRLEDFIRNVRIVDLLDVAFISFFLYLLINWLRKSASRQTIISVIVLICLYILARVTEMYLTEILLEGLFIVILIGTVVVFQSDIRRLADQIGSSRLFQRNKNTPTTFDKTTIDIITESVAKMAKNRTGALIAIKGKEGWDRHIHGGITMDGEVSIPLLHSIFNPTSPGHDGAVLMENSRIMKFGAHLPLSTQLSKISRGGTRHVAALGLSECCDALIIVVSEERGTVSIAQSDQLTELESINYLKGILITFWEEHYKNEETGWSQWQQKIHPRIALTSVALSIIFWFAFSYNVETIYRSFSVPIEYRNLNTSKIALQDSLPIEARVTLAGSEQAFRLLDPGQLAISLDLASRNTGQEILEITENNIELPSDLRLYDVTPEQLNIETKALKRIDLPVRIQTRGELPDQYTLESITPEPDTVTVLLKEGDKPDSIRVEPIDLGEVNGSTDLTISLDLPAGIILPEGVDNQITVHIKVKEKGE